MTMAKAGRLWRRPKLNLFRGAADYHAQQKAAWDARSGEEDVKRFEEGVELEVRQALAEYKGAELHLEAASAALNWSRTIACDRIPLCTGRCK